MVYKAAGLYSLAVPAGDEPILAIEEDEYPTTFRITMAAIDPSAPAQYDEESAEKLPPRATLKMIRLPMDDDEEDDSEDEYSDSDMADLLGESDEEDDEEANGGPSDPSKSPKAQRRAALRAALADARAEMELDAEDDDAPKAKGKGKAPVADAEDDEDDEDLDDDEDDEDMEDALEGAEEVVLCTLDPTKQTQQTLDITVMEHERVLFMVTGTHDVYLSGNVLYDSDDRGDIPGLYDSDEEDSDVDLSPDDDEIDMLDAYDSEEDDLDDIDDPRIEELDDDEDAAPALIKAAKGKNKRAADDSAESTPVKAEAANGSLSKSQQKKLAKKLKDNAGNAVEVAHTKENGVGGASKETVEATKANAKGDKKVQFAKTLVQGPTGAAANDKEDKKKAGSGKRTVQGVEIDDKVVGKGPQAKNGDTVSMRYIGKLQADKKVFDSNKKGKPFSFKLGKGEVIKGWDIGIAGMSAEGERRITIPAHLAYGSRGAPPDIPPNATLIFEVKLLEIKKK